MYRPIDPSDTTTPRFEMVPQLPQTQPLDHQTLNDDVLAAPSVREAARQTKLATALRNGFDPDADVDVELTVETYSGIESDVQAISDLEQEIDS